LLAVPRATAGATQARHDLEKSRDVLGLSRHEEVVRIRADGVPWQRKLGRSVRRSPCGIKT
jgi:hypothetical protein